MLLKMVSLTIIVSFSVLFSGCATILSDKTQKINLISSKPQKVEINGQLFNAPNIIELQRPSSDGILKIPECNKTILMPKKMNNVFFANIFFIYGSSTDLSTGALWEYDQTNINIDCI